MRWAATDPPKKVETPSMERNKIYRDRAMNADVDIEPTILAFLYSAVQQEPSDEINGFGHVDEAGLLDWASIVSVGTTGAVASSPQDMAWATVQCLEAVEDVPNMQLHTHPGFDTFFSGTDTNDIVKFVIETRDNLDVENGEMYFMVFNLESWLVRKVEWAPKGAYYNDGLVYANGIPFQETVAVVQSFGKTNYTQGSYNQRGVSYNNNFQGNKPAGGVIQQPAGNVVTPAKKVEPVKADPTTAAPHASPHQSHLYSGQDFGESWWDYSPDLEGSVNGGGAIIVAGAETKSIPVLMEHPLENEHDIKDMILAYDRDELLIGFVLDKGYYDVLEMKNHLLHTEQPDVWQALLKEIRENEKDINVTQADTETFVKMVRESARTGNVADAAMVLDVCDWFTGQETLEELLKYDRELYTVLTANAGGYTFGMILILISDNLNRAPSEQQAMEANQRLLQKLPPSVLETFQKYIEEVWDDRKAPVNAKA